MKGQPLSEETKAKMAAGRKAARERRAAAALALPIGALDETHTGAVEDAFAIERRRRLLGDLDPETAALFTDADLEKIEREENEKALAERKRQALADVRAVARQHAQVENDLISHDTLRSDAEKKRLAEPVTFRVTVPGDGAGHRGQSGFRVDGRLFQNGRTYTVPRAVFESLLSNHHRVWFNEIQFKTLDQQKPGNSAQEILAQTIPNFEVRRAA